MLRIKNQNGTILVVSLLLLLVMTILAVSSINMSTMDLRIVNNTQQQMEAEVAVSEAIEKVMSYSDNFDIDDPDANPTISVNGTKTTLGNNVITVNGRNVQIDGRECIQTRPDTGDSIREKSPTGAFTTGKFIKIWKLTASHEDPVSGAKVTMNQGVRMRMLSVLCP